MTVFFCLVRDKTLAFKVFSSATASSSLYLHAKRLSVRGIGHILTGGHKDVIINYYKTHIQLPPLKSYYLYFYV